MSKDNQPVKFEWTDELVKEYGREFGYAGEPDIEEFKKSHSKTVQETKGNPTIEDLKGIVEIVKRDFLND